MKMVLCAFVLLVDSLTVYGQGQVWFFNSVPGALVTHVYAPLPGDPSFHQIGNGPTDTPLGTQDWLGFTAIGANGTNGPYGGSTTFAQLLGAEGFNQPDNSLQPALPVNMFRTGSGAGLLMGRTSTLSNVPWFDPATVEMVVWDNSSGLYPTWVEASAAWASGLIAAGESGPLNQQLYSPLEPAPLLTSLQSFNLYFVPEPCAAGLAVLGGVVALARVWLRQQAIKRPGVINKTPRGHNSLSKHPSPQLTTL